MSELESKFREIVKNLSNSMTIRYARQDNSEEKDELGCPIPEKIVVIFSFSEAGFGFGDITLVQKNEQLFIDTERTARDHVKYLFNMLADNAILDTDDDPEKHKLFNKEMGRTCSDACAVCGKESALE